MGDDRLEPRKASKPINRRRAEVISEWRGAVDPPNPERNITNAGAWIDKLMEQVGLAEGLEIEEIRSTWRKITDDFIASHTEPVSLKKGVLCLRVVQPSMRHHLMQMQGQLKKKLQEKLGEKKIRDLKILLG